MGYIFEPNRYRSKYWQKKSWIGLYAKANPPLRAEEERGRLLQILKSGVIDTRCFLSLPIFFNLHKPGVSWPDYYGSSGFDFVPSAWQ